MTLTPFPLNHSTQIPDNALLDVSGKQTYLGNSFVLPQNGKALMDTSEDPILYIQNPSTSGKAVFVNLQKIATDNNTIFVRFYFNPTINSLGSSTKALNLRTGYNSITSSITNCYLSPTTTSNGTLIAALPATIYSITSNVLYVIDPGSSLLVTGQQSTSGTTNCFVEISWYEL